MGSTNSCSPRIETHCGCCTLAADMKPPSVLDYAGPLRPRRGSGSVRFSFAVVCSVLDFSVSLFASWLIRGVNPLFPPTGMGSLILVVEIPCFFAMLIMTAITNGLTFQSRRPALAAPPADRRVSASDSSRC